MLNPTVLGLARKVVPTALYRRLDPFEASIADFVGETARGTGSGMVVLDAGAGESRFRDLFGHASYIGMDSGEGDPDWDYSGLDVVGRLEELPIADEVCDRVLSIVVLEHTSEPQRVLEQFFRALRPGGSVHMVVPHMWEEHQRPHDYFRYTSSGIRYLLETAGFDVIDIRPVGGFFWQLGRRLMGVLSFTQQGWRWVLFPFLAPLFGLILPLGCYYLDVLDRDRAYTLGFICEGRKQTT
jgi:SAM-dependent methyltransferase